MNVHKENRIKSQCFKAATTIFAASLPRNSIIRFEEHHASTIYSIALKLFKNGKDRYWKTADYATQYEHRFLKRIYIWLKEKFWEKKKEVDKYGKCNI